MSFTLTPVSQKPAYRPVPVRRFSAYEDRVSLLLSPFASG
jgi:hypothetical protein